MKEFMEFAKEIRLNFGKLTIEEIYKKVDSDNSGHIDFNEFVNYLEELTSGKEFEADIDKFSGKKGFLDTNDLILFFKEIQKEEQFQLFDAVHMILRYNKEIPEDLLKIMEEKLYK